MRHQRPLVDDHDDEDSEDFDLAQIRDASRAQVAFHDFFDAAVKCYTHTDQLDPDDQVLQDIIRLSMRYPGAFAKVFTWQHSKAKKQKRPGERNPQIVRSLMVFIMLQTLFVLHSRGYAGVTLSDGDLMKSVRGTFLATNTTQWRPPQEPLFGRTTQVYVLPLDTVEAGEDLLGRGLHPVILNMANANHPGGGFQKGASAQEEDLMRRSNYCQSLANYHSPRGVRRSFEYPIDEFGGVYTPGVVLFRGTSAKGYAFLRDPVKLACIAVAAYNRPPLDHGCLRPDIAAKTKRKIRTILLLARRFQHDSIVLGALGCGAFRNPPRDVARLFREVILEFAGDFKEIAFGIIGDSNDLRGNFAAFAEVFGTFKKPSVVTRGEKSSVDMLSYDSPPRPSAVAVPVAVAAEEPAETELPRCPYGADCYRDNPEHRARFSHPKSKSKSTQRGPQKKHAGKRPRCKYGRRCPYSTEDHRWRFEHPPDVDSRPMCQYGMKCYCRDPTHAESFRHPQGWKPAVAVAAAVASRRGKGGGYSSAVDSLSDFSLFPSDRPVCRYGKHCYNDDDEHARTTRHPRGWSPRPRSSTSRGSGGGGGGRARRLPACPYGASCYRRGADHARECWHPAGWFPGKVKKPGSGARRSRGDD